MSQEKKKLSIKTCKMVVVPDKSGRGYTVKVSGDCDEELEQIKSNMGPQGYRYLEKRLIREE